MKRLRIILLAFFAVVFIAFAVNRVLEFITSDSEAPVITAEQDKLELSVTATDEDLLVGMTALDSLDGNVTDTLTVVSKSHFITKGTQRINYAAFDKNNNVGTYSREVTYVDYHSPHFHMKRPLRFVSGNSTYDYLSRITVEDCLDGDLTQQIKITTGETENVGDSASTRQINLQVTNSAGDTVVLDLTARFEEYDTYNTSAPALDDYILYVPLGERPDYASHLIGILSGNRLREFKDTSYNAAENVTINDSEVDYQTPGVYSVKYQLAYTNKEGLLVRLGTTTLIVIVED